MSNRIKLFTKIQKVKKTHCRFLKGPVHVAYTSFLNRKLAIDIAIFLSIKIFTITCKYIQLMINQR